MTDSGAYVDPPYHAKLTDFGLSKIKIIASRTTTLYAGTDKGGTLPWMAPELFTPGNPKTKASDVYALALVLWELGTRRVPFKRTLDEIEDPLQFGMLMLMAGMGNEAAIVKTTETVAEGTPPRMAHLITLGWIRNPASRPTTAQACAILNEEFPRFRP